MALVELGSQSSDTPKTPTLKQYIQQQGGKCPNRSTVKMIFLPGKFDTWSFITDHGFRVSIDQSNSLYDIVTDTVMEWIRTDTCLTVVVSDPKTTKWSLSVDTDENSDWQVFEWGYKLSLMPKKKRDRTKTATVE